MRHGKHRFQLGVKKEHRVALMANLAVALIMHGRIKTTLAKAKALRPFIEKLITFSVKASKAEDAAQNVHFRRLVAARLQGHKQAVQKLFNERAEEFLNRPGGYTRIYKLLERKGDAAPMALIEFIDASDEGYKSRKSKSKKAGAKRKVVQNPENAEKKVAPTEEPAATSQKAEPKKEEEKSES